MTDFVSEAEVALLLATEAQPAELVQLDVLEEREQAGASPITLKAGDAFLVADGCGDFLASRQEMGIFRHGTRFLRTANLYLEGHHLVPLSHQVAQMGDASHIDLTNVPFTTAQQHPIEQGTVHINRFLELEQDCLTQTLTLTSFHPVALPLTLTMQIGADFCDLFEVRGFSRQRRGDQFPAKQEAGTVSLRYRGLDRIERTTRVESQPIAPSVRDERIDWVLLCQPGVPITLRVMFRMSESSAEKLETHSATTPWREDAQTTLPMVQSSDPFFNRFLTRGMQDLKMLSTMTPYGYYPYAGIPWFSCPFGRDGLITALEFLPWFPQVMRGTLEFLAAYQGTKVDPFTDQEPGKILHEFRTGEMANCREIAFVPYYGTIDATPLFLIALDAYLRWTNDLELAGRLWPNVEAAARWLVEYGDRDGDGFLEFDRASEKGLVNQSWKDSWDSTSHRDGRIAASPIAHCEVQGYAFAAYRAIGSLARRLGKNVEAASWDARADTFQSEFLRAYWWEQEQTFYMALAENKEPCDVVVSNAGQCLWSGIVPDEQARQVVQRLMREDMFSGWGIRTLSTQARRYNPLSYHNGSIWPHDNALVGAGFALYGAKDEAGQVLKSLFDASAHFADARLPELYCGFARRPGYGPTRYPVACAPQGWAAGSPFLLLSALLGLHPDAANHRLVLDGPTLPEWLTSLELKGLYVGDRHVHLRFVRVGEQTEVVLGRENEVDVRVL
jgi:glycogen debranching enzyme